MQSTRLKDDHLATIGDEYNVAQFVSFGSGYEPEVRHLKVRDVSENSVDSAAVFDLEAALRILLSSTDSVNIRVFSSSPVKSAPFHYGITQIQDAVALVRKYASDGFYTIVNETIDVKDGGVSGVSLGGIVEFAPEDTPRVVEKAGTVRLSRSLACEMLESVYGFAPKLPERNDLRIEFSIHPLRVGYRQTHTVIWEREEIDPIELPWQLTWPNRFSRFIGDKAFGLLVAHLLGAPVPTTTVVARKVPPFTFGKRTGSCETWLRTCPVEQIPGKFKTALGWQDPFALLANEDPSGGAIASVLAQKAVRAEYSGASIPGDRCSDEVEGVRGRGDWFMLGGQEPQPLPERIIKDVQALTEQLGEVLGPVRIEWAHDGVSAWVLQLHVADQAYSGGVIYPGDASIWISFDPLDGLERLRALAKEATMVRAGIEITRPVGATSHIGDILRKAKIPSRMRAQVS